MNKLILNTGVQNFIEKNWRADIMSVLLKKPIFEGISQKELAEQLESKKKCQDKLPTWFNTPEIYFPNKLNIEQTSSEQTAVYKASLVDGKSLIDLTGGFGVDSYHFAKKITQVFHCEISPKLAEIARHNFKVLDQENINSIEGDGIEILKTSDQKYDWVYLDPSRRDEYQGKVFLLEHCTPNVPQHLSDIFNKTDNVLIKVSPLLDISQGIKELNFVKEIHVVAINNEVKELLFVLKRGYLGQIQIKTINKNKARDEIFDFQLESESDIETRLGTPNQYLYEPNSAILKSGGFKSVAHVYGLDKLHQHSHLYTSNQLVDFPGRRFEVMENLPYAKNVFKTRPVSKANVTTRNFPMTVSQIRKKHKIKDGGELYLFFTTDMNNELRVLMCQKV